jgi:hypothetical protein
MDVAAGRFAKAHACLQPTRNGNLSSEFDPLSTNLAKSFAFLDWIRSDFSIGGQSIDFTSAEKTFRT